MSDERRKEDRYEVKIDAAIRNGTGVDREVAIMDLSASGCRLTWSKGAMRQDACLVISAGPVRAIEAVVRWTDGNEHGIEFVTALHPAVVDHLRYILNRHPAWITQSEEDTAAA